MANEFKIQKKPKNLDFSRIFDFPSQQGMRESNSHQRFWRPLSYHLTNPLRYRIFKTTYMLTFATRSWPCLRFRRAWSPRNFVAQCLLLRKCLSSHITALECKHSSLYVRRQPLVSAFWSSPHPISSSQLHVLPHFHLCPINLVVFKGSFKINLREF